MLIPVHSVIATADSGDFAYADFGDLLLQPAHIIRARGGRGVPAVHKAVDINRFHPLALTQLQQSVKMRVVAVDAAVGQQAHQMNGAAGGFCPAAGFCQGRVFKKISVFNGFGNAGQLLVNNPACADVGMPHLAVAHLSVGQAHVQTRAADGPPRALLHQLVHHRRFGQSNGVVFSRRRQTISI